MGRTINSLVYPSHHDAAETRSSIMPFVENQEPGVRKSQQHCSFLLLLLECLRLSPREGQIGSTNRRVSDGGHANPSSAAHILISPGDHHPIGLARLPHPNNVGVPGLSSPAELLKRRPSQFQIKRLPNLHHATVFLGQITENAHNHRIAICLELREPNLRSLWLPPVRASVQQVRGSKSCRGCARLAITFVPFRAYALSSSGSSAAHCVRAALQITTSLPTKNGPHGADESGHLPENCGRLHLSFTIGHHSLLQCQLRILLVHPGQQPSQLLLLSIVPFLCKHSVGLSKILEFGQDTIQVLDVITTDRQASNWCSTLLHLGLQQRSAGHHRQPTPHAASVWHGSVWPGTRNPTFAVSD
mmetsp:Transcript_49321/g.107631  ORF Transcript_49321/g.107631 Transcript_49321/m.107631 type:complete len:359 (+) Transcript_49321:802-1878(+)